MLPPSNFFKNQEWGICVQNLFVARRTGGKQSAGACSVNEQVLFNGGNEFLPIVCEFKQ